MNAQLKPLQMAAAGFQADLRDLRARIAEAAEETQWIESAPLPKDEITERLAAAVDREAARFEAEHRGQIVHGDIDGLLVTSSTTVISISKGAASGSGTSTMNVTPMLCWLLPDAVKARLAAALEPLDFEAGPPTAERPDLIEAAQQRLLALEIEEEAMIAEAEAAGLDVTRRADANPAVILDAHEVHQYKFKAVPEHGDYYFAEVVSDEQLTRGEIMQRARHTLPSEWSQQNDLKDIEILEPIDSDDILPGDDFSQQQPAQRARARQPRKAVASPYLEAGGLDPTLRAEIDSNNHRDGGR